MTTRTDRIHSRLTPIEPAAERLPFWTRSTNPIVRRHLGLYWRTLPPELLPVLKIMAGWALILFVGALMLDVLYFALIVLIVSVIVLPVATLMYAHILLDIAVRASDMMQEEKRNNTLNLLMATPMSLQQILLGKVAAAMWRRMEDWTLITYAVALAAPPLFFSMYIDIWQNSVYPLAMPLAVMGGLVVSLLRLVLEPLMVGMIAVSIGALVPYRNTAISLAVVLSAAYVAIMWLISQLPIARGMALRDGTRIQPDYFMVVLIDFVLPIAVPALVTWLLLRVTVNLLRRD
jgi:hypothetical protein